MDVMHVNPFIESFTNIMPQLGFSNVQKGNLSIKNQEIVCSGVVIILGIIGMIKGNVVFCVNTEDAKKIASTMMMGMEIEELDELSKSALSELTNMLTANAATIFFNDGITIDISTPNLLYGDNISIQMSSKQVLSIELLVDEITLELNIAFQN
jgi:chemotaxis protein CheX